MLYEFTCNVTVQGVPRTAGEVVDESDIPTGSLENLLRMSQVKELPAPAPDSLEPTQPRSKRKG